VNKDTSASLFNIFDARKESGGCHMTHNEKIQGVDIKDTCKVAFRAGTMMRNIDPNCTIEQGFEDWWEVHQMYSKEERK